MWNILSSLCYSDILTESSKAADKSLQELKGLTVTSEQQLAAGERSFSVLQYIMLIGERPE